MILQIIITGYSILICAIIANNFAIYFELSTWYEFLQSMNNYGFKKTILSQTIIDIIWLYFIYPILLSIGYRLGDKLSFFVL